MKKYHVFLIKLLSIFLTIFVFSVSTLATPVSQTNQKSISKPQNAPVMLAHTWNEKIDIKGWWISEKLDGVRAYWTGKELISRLGNSFHVPQWFTKNFPSTPLDGELWIGRDQFSEIVSIVRSKNSNENWRKVCYFIFDAPEIKGGFEKRLDFVRLWFQEHENKYAKLLKHEICESKEELKRKVIKIESIGGEGVILRKPDSLYEIGRSYNLLKFKTYQDTEATVVKHIPGSGRNKGRLGSLLVKLPNGIKFRIGTGFSDKERENPPCVGSTITFKYHGFYKSGIPRFASFLRVREQF